VGDTELIQGVWHLPGGKGKNLDTLVEFLTWLQARAATTRQDTVDWFQERFSAGKSSPYALYQIRDLGVAELERGKNAAVRLTDLGRAVLQGDPETRARLVADQFMMQFAATREILALYTASAEPVGLREVHKRLGQQFPTWTTPIQFGERLAWLDCLGLLSCVTGRTYRITDLGRQFSEKYPPAAAGPPGSGTVTQPPGNDGVVVAPPAPPATTVDAVIRELREAAVDSGKPKRFEAAVGSAFEWLGFAVTPFGESGNTDVLVTAEVGNEPYSVVVDAKARGAGKVDSLDLLNLKDHKAQNEADHVVVVAGSFAGGKVAGHAVEHGVTLLPLAALEEWLRLHDSWPQDLVAYRTVFAVKGVVESLPAALRGVAEERKRWGRLLAEVVDLLSDTYSHGLVKPLTAEMIFNMLVTRLRGVRYPEKDVASTLQLLAHPVVGALAVKDGGYILVMSRDTLALRLRRLAEEVEVLDDGGEA
jgi:hypothetical protein